MLKFKKTKYISLSRTPQEVAGVGQNTADLKTQADENPDVLQGSDTAGKENAAVPEVPQGLWTKCPKCSHTVYTKDLEENDFICSHCKKYVRMGAWTRLKMIMDEESFTPWDEDLETENPLNFPEYPQKLARAKEASGLKEAVVCGQGTIDGAAVAVAVMDAAFFMGSMGHVVGEKITRLMERATQSRLPVIVYCCSGGARMQEGMISLMQMAKTAAAVKRHSDAGLPYFTVLTDPTTGGVTASFAMLGDVILAEPGALIGFAGPRVIEQTIGQKLPKGFQSAEFLLEHGFVDAIVERKDQKRVLKNLITWHMGGGKL